MAEGLVTIACLGVLIFAFRGTRQVRGGLPIIPRKPRSRLARTIATLLVLALIVIQVVLFNFRLNRKQAAAAHHASGARRSSSHNPAHLITAHPSWSLSVLVAAAVIAAVVLVVSSRADRREPAEPEPEPDAGASIAPLRAALADASGAVREPGDPRHAIIASYAAMEARLAQAGAPAAAADTPAEVLARAAAAGLVRSPAAHTLTALFRRARYSRHSVAESDRACAAGALERLRADLGDGQ